MKAQGEGNQWPNFRRTFLKDFNKCASMLRQKTVIFCFPCSIYNATGYEKLEILQAAEAGSVKTSLENKRARSYWDKNQETQNEHGSFAVLTRASDSIRTYLHQE